MKQDTNEILSALMDDEITIDTAERIGEIARDDELRQTWYRYHLIRDAIQGEINSDIDCSMAQRISRLLADEPVVLAPVNSGRNRYIKPIAGLAIAASVAAAVLLGIQVSNRQAAPESTPAFASNTVPQAPRTVQFVSSNSGPANTANSTNVTFPMNRYLVNYNEHRANSGVRGMLPYVRIVGHETPR
jgi:sigma-E factor negative regulatory protein RseA